MSLRSTVPPGFLEDLSYVGDPVVARLLEMVVALGGELFVLKAEAERLRRALDAHGGVDAGALDAISSSPGFQAWLAKEQAAFARHLFDPIARGRGIREPGEPDA